MIFKCPQIESANYLCDREANYQIDGVVYCQIHAKRLMEFRSHEHIETETLEMEEEKIHGYASN
jgi:hypothetical protein